MKTAANSSSIRKVTGSKGAAGRQGVNVANRSPAAWARGRVGKAVTGGVIRPRVYYRLS
jgi:hypothetical protein